MAEAHQRDVRDDQDGQQGLQACMVLPNVTVLISFFFLILMMYYRAAHLHFQ